MDDAFDAPTALERVPYFRERIQTDDGVALAVQSVGQGPTVLLANGIGVNTPGLDFIAEHLRRRYRVVAWDYRGTGGSRIERWPVDLGMPRHAADALAILDALDARCAAILGWSMGVPVALEVIRRAPERVAAFGALFGAPGRPFDAAFPARAAGVVHGLVAVARHVPGPSQAVLRLAEAIPSLCRAVCVGTGFCGPNASREVFQAHVRSTRMANKRAYFGTMYEMMLHDASDVLPSVRCPALVVAGEKDWVTPPSTAEEMARRIPGAQLVVMPDTSHFGVIERGPSLWHHLDRLLEVADFGS
jgi:pimeloyl-ACP methyl ester carboxylesterase